MTPEGGSRSREEAFGGGPSNMTVPQLSERPKRRYQEQRMHLNQISARQLNGRAKQEAIAAINANLGRASRSRLEADMLTHTLDSRS